MDVLNEYKSYIGNYVNDDRINEIEIKDYSVSLKEYDDIILKFQLTWEQVGPRYTLKEMKLI